MALISMDIIIFFLTRVAEQFNLRKYDGRDAVYGCTAPGSIVRPSLLSSSHALRLSLAVLAD
jgi:hypothetical protein